MSRSESEAPNEGTDTDGLHFRPRVFVPLIIFLALVVHLLLPRLAVLDQSLHVFRSLSIGILTAALAAQALSYVANGALLRLIVVSSRERLRLPHATAVVMAASTVCLIAWRNRGR